MYERNGPIYRFFKQAMNARARRGNPEEGRGAPLSAGIRAAYRRRSILKGAIAGVRLAAWTIPPGTDDPGASLPSRKDCGLIVRSALVLREADGNPGSGWMRACPRPPGVTSPAGFTGENFWRGYTRSSRKRAGCRILELARRERSHEGEEATDRLKTRGEKGCGWRSMISEGYPPSYIGISDR